MAEEDADETTSPGYVPRTEGQRLLRLVTAKRKEIADACSVSQPLVTYWRQGAKLPGSALRQKLFEVYGIPATAWNTRPGETPQARTDTTSEDATARPTIDLVNERINLYATMVTNEALDYEMRLRAGELERKCIAERRSLERDARAREADVVARSPEWSNVRRRTLDVLKHHPEALRAWVDAMGVYARDNGAPPADDDEEDET